MAEVKYSETLAQNVRGRVVVLTSGAQGIGAATVTLLHSLGAHIIFGDISQTAGAELEASLSALRKSSPDRGTAHFMHADVCNYVDQLALFDDAFRLHGRVDAGVTCAGVPDQPSWFDPSTLTLEAVREVLSKRFLIQSKSPGPNSFPPS